MKIKLNTTIIDVVDTKPTESINTHNYNRSNAPEDVSITMIGFIFFFYIAKKQRI